MASNSPWAKLSMLLDLKIMTKPSAESAYRKSQRNAIHKNLKKKFHLYGVSLLDGQYPDCSFNSSDMSVPIAYLTFYGVIRFDQSTWLQ